MLIFTRFIIGLIFLFIIVLTSSFNYISEYTYLWIFDHDEWKKQQEIIKNSHKFHWFRAYKRNILISPNYLIDKDIFGNVVVCTYAFEKTLIIPSLIDTEVYCGGEHCLLLKKYFENKLI